MTSRWSKTNLLFLLVFLINVELSKEECPDYFELEYLRHNFTKRIPLIKTKDPKDILECSLEGKSLEDDDFRPIVHHCFSKEPREEKFKTVLKKCEGALDKAVSFYRFMCMLAHDIKMPTPACDDLDAPCQHWLRGSPLVYDSTTVTAPTTLPERTTTAPPPNTTPVPPSPTTNATSTNASGPIRGQISPNSTVNTWNTGCLVFLIISLCLVAGLVVYCLFLRRRLKRTEQLLETLQLQEWQSQTPTRTRENNAESTALMEAGASRNAAEENGSQL